DFDRLGDFQALLEPVDAVTIGIVDLEQRRVAISGFKIDVRDAAGGFRHGDGECREPERIYVGNGPGAALLEEVARWVDWVRVLVDDVKAPRDRPGWMERAANEVVGLVHPGNDAAKYDQVSGERAARLDRQVRERPAHGNGRAGEQP